MGKGSQKSAEVIAIGVIIFLLIGWAIADPSKILISIMFIFILGYTIKSIIREPKASENKDSQMTS